MIKGPILLGCRLRGLLNRLFGFIGQIMAVGFPVAVQLWLGGGGFAQFDPKAAPTGLALNADLTAHALHRAANDCQADAGAAVFGTPMQALK